MLFLSPYFHISSFGSARLIFVKNTVRPFFVPVFFLTLFFLQLTSKLTPPPFRGGPLLSRTPTLSGLVALGITLTSGGLPQKQAEEVQNVHAPFGNAMVLCSV